MVVQLISSRANNGDLAAAASVHCHPSQAVALLQLKRSFTFDDSNTTLQSWEAGTDCCLWEGVGCDASSGEVTAINLGGRGLYSYGIDGAIFNLTSLQHLDLSGNDFGGSPLPAAGFEKLTSLTHLNLPMSGSYGHVPISIAYLTNLISLDLSNQESSDNTSSWNMLMLWEPSFTALLANLSNLKELYLYGMDVSASGEDWCKAVATHVPHLKVLSLEDCGLYGPIHSALSRLPSVTVINLDNNFGISGEVPDFFADFLNLSVLPLRYCDLHGLFPS